MHLLYREMNLKRLQRIFHHTESRQLLDSTPSKKYGTIPAPTTPTKSTITDYQKLNSTSNINSKNVGDGDVPTSSDNALYRRNKPNKSTNHVGRLYFMAVD